MSEIFGGKALEADYLKYASGRVNIGHSRVALTIWTFSLIERVTRDCFRKKFKLNFHELMEKIEQKFTSVTAKI